MGTVSSFCFSQHSGPSIDSDQNPNYLISQNKYMAIKDSLISTENTTIQQTYKAYDWYEAKLENRAARRETRRQVRIARANTPSYYNYGYGYGNGYGLGFGNNFGYNGWGPSIGLGFGLYNRPHWGYGNRCW